MRKLLFPTILSHHSLIFFVLLILFFPLSYLFANKITLEEISKVTTFRENQISGYGLVVGLSQTGDSKNKIGEESLKKILEFNGIDVSNNMLKSKNIAAVWVTAKIPPFSRIGDKIDIWVSSIGDAKSLTGGYLLQSPLYGADKEIYAVAQSSISENTTNSKNRASYKDRATTVYIQEAAIVEKKISQPFFIERNNKNIIQLTLFHFNLKNAERVIQAINKIYPESSIVTEDAIIEIEVPENENSIFFLSKILSIEIEHYIEPKIVINPRTSTIVIGKSVKISPVSIIQEKFSLRVKEYNFQNTGIQSFSDGLNVEFFVQQLNSIGFSVKEIIPILKALHTAGAIQADLIIL